MAAKKGKKKPAEKPAKTAPTKSDISRAPKNSAISVEMRRRARFIKEYLIDLNGAAAARRAGYGFENARDTAHYLLGQAEVKDAISKAQEARATKLGITAEKVLERYIEWADADPAEFVVVRNDCCRYCYGKDHEYQYTPRELQAAIADFNRAKMEAESKKLQFPMEFVASGGCGFDPRRDPHPNCPECHGRGVTFVQAKDPRDMTPKARKAFDGAEVTQHGIKMHGIDRKGALDAVAKHLGMFQTNVKHSNDPKNPMPAAVGVVLVPVQAEPSDDVGT